MNELDLSIVVPAHNEVSLLGSTITNLVTGLLERNIRYELVVIENGSTDGTLKLARVLAAQLPELRVHSLARGNYGAALAAGFNAARGNIVVNFDADYYSLTFIDDALALLRDKDIDLVLASKRIRGSRDRRPVLRRVLTFGFAFALRTMVQLEATDAHGMKAMKRASLVPIVDQCVLRGSLFDVELVLRSMQSGLGVAELPAVVVERRPPRTSISGRSLESLVGLVRLRLVMRREALTRQNKW